MKLSNLHGKKPHEVLRSLDDVFASHNGADLFEIIAGQCNGERGLHTFLVVDARSAERALNGQMSNQLEMFRTGDTLEIERCTHMKVLLAISSRTHSTPQSQRASNDRRQIDASFSQSTSLPPSLTFVTHSPHS